MSERAPFLNTAYSAYHHRERPAEDEELTRVGPGTPCGEYLRRFWQPVILSSELGELPRRLRILGEDLVAFRDKSGAIGLLELHCPHRGTSLEFGLIGDKGIRCCYHGWLFDVRRHDPRDPGRARRQHVEGPAVSRRLSGARILGPGLCLYGAAGQEARFSDPRYLRPARLPPDCPRADAVGMQLAAGQRKQHGPGASRLSAHPSGQRGLYRRFQGTGRVGLDGDPGRHGLHRHAPAGGPGVGARRRLHPPQHPPVPAQCRPDGTAQLDQSAAGDDLGGAARRHPHDADRLSPRARRPGGHGAAPVSARTASGPTRSGSGFPATTTRRSAFMAAWRGTGSNISPRPTAASS